MPSSHCGPRICFLPRLPGGTLRSFTLCISFLVIHGRRPTFPLLHLVLSTFNLSCLTSYPPHRAYSYPGVGPNACTHDGHPVSHWTQMRTTQLDGFLLGCTTALPRLARRRQVADRQPSILPGAREPACIRGHTNGNTCAEQPSAQMAGSPVCVAVTASGASVSPS